MTNTPTIRPRLRRSISIPTINKSRISTASDEGNEQSTLSKNVVYHGSFTILPSSSTFYERLVEYRSHEFKSERRVLKELCFVCKGSIRPFFNEGVKCQACRLHFHRNCRQRASLPCIPWSEPPKAINGRLRLGEYCADALPKLPHLILRCVNYLNKQKHSRGLYTNMNTEISEKADHLLKLLTNNKVPPDFDTYGPQAASQCIIKFLSNLRESLIPESSAEEFLNASIVKDNFEIETSIFDLPIVHKNTLAYLCIHWKFLSEQNEINDITPELLGNALMPVIMHGIMQNVKKYVPVFIRLLSLSYTFYSYILEEGCKHFPSTPMSRSSSKKGKVDLSRSITVAKLQASNGTIRRNKIL